MFAGLSIELLEILVTRPVKVGVAGDEYFEVLDGLNEGEVIASGPYQTIRDLKEGARVRKLKPSADSAKVQKRE